MVSNKMNSIEEYIVTVYCCMIGDCRKTYSTKFNLKRHVEVTHLKQKKFKCELCEKYFVSQQNLKEHIFTHTGAKPYECSYCGEFFRQISQLSLHRRAHEFKEINFESELTECQRVKNRDSLAEMVIQKIKNF